MQLMVNAHSDKVNVSEVIKGMGEERITFEDVKHKGTNILAWISNYIHCFVCDVKTQP